MTFCYFTTPEHYPELDLSVASIRQFHPQAGVLAILRPGDAPPPDKSIYLYHREFARGQHLSGTEATIGVIQSLAAIADRFSGPLVKIDSDMILHDSFPTDPSGVCFRRPNGSFVGIYSLPATIAARLPEVIDSARARGTVSLPSEASRICGFAARHGISVRDIFANLPEIITCIPYSVLIRSHTAAAPRQLRDSPPHSRPAIPNANP